MSKPSLDLTRDLCHYTRNTGFTIMKVVLKDIPIDILLIMIQYASIYEPEGGCQYPFMIKSTYDPIIREILDSKTRINIVTAPPSDIRDIEIKTILMKHSEWKQQEASQWRNYIDVKNPNFNYDISSSSSNVWHITTSIEHSCYIHGRFDTIQEFFPWMSHLNEEVNTCWDALLDENRNLRAWGHINFVIVDNIHDMSVSQIMKICSHDFMKLSNKIILFGIDYTPELIELIFLKESIRFIQCNKNNIGELTFTSTIKTKTEIGND